MNFSELKHAVSTYVENYDDAFVAALPIIVRVAEKLIYNDANLPTLKKNVRGNIAAHVPYIEFPSDLLSPLSVTTIINGEQQPLLNKDVSYLREAFPKEGVLGVPMYYAIFDETNLMLAPTPSQGYELELHYRAYPESITDSDDKTTWLSVQYEHTLLKASVLEAYRFMKAEEDILKAADAAYRESLAQIKQAGQGWMRQDSYRSGEPREAVR